MMTNEPNYIAVSQELLYAVRTGNHTQQHVAALQQAPEEALAAQLQTDAHRKAFWLNIYNAFVQQLLKENPGRYRNRSDFFTRRQITIAGKPLSLDDIEHSLLRRSKIKWGLGYLNKWFPGRFEKKFRLDVLDYRIHFALNCGAKSCPPIAYYRPDKIDHQLELATKNYLQNEAEYKVGENTVYLPAVMKWYRGDFGGKNGMLQILQQQHILPAGARPNISFKKYNWALFLDNYKSSEE